ncbi:type IV pilus biogenesis protein PilM [Pseudomonas parafulva]|uniref:type IV pilus biogenesis protein PilM n=1 Tax=Pseudomonas parafulva TaxID=157782 RepID=UPI0003F7467A|nr:pilus assembly protein PilM [Pseudomonas parafulva]
MIGRFGKDAGSFSGLEITAGSVRALQLRRRKRHYHVVSWAEELFDPPAGTHWMAQPASVVAALQRMRRRSGLRKVAMALPADQVICKYCQLPLGLDEGQMEAQLLADAERLFPFPLDDLALDFQVLHACAAQPGLAQVMVAACRQSTLASLEALVAEAGLQLEAVEVDTLALRRLVPAASDQDVALLRLSPHDATLHRLKPGGGCLRRELLLDAGPTPESIQRKLSDECLPAHLWVVSAEPYHQAWLAELQARLDVHCSPVPGLAGLVPFNGAMLLAGALAIGGVYR